MTINVVKTVFCENILTQHYKPICFGGISKQKAEEKFQKQQLHDKIKTEYCVKNNIPLLRIPFFRFEETYYLIAEFVYNCEFDE